MEVRKQFVGIDSVLLPCDSQDGTWLSVLTADAFTHRAILLTPHIQFLRYTLWFHFLPHKQEQSLSGSHWVPTHVIVFPDTGSGTDL